MMDMSSPPGAASSPDLTAPGNLEILAHTAASQASDLHGAGETPPFHGFPVFKLSDSNPHSLPLLYPHIKTEGQPGGPMLSQAQIQKIFGGPDPKEAEKRASPLSIITTTFSDPGQVSPAAPSQSSQILNYGSSNVAGDAMLSAINYNDNEILHDGAFDVPGNLGGLDDGLLGGMSNQRLTENASGHSFDLFDGEGDSLNMEAFSPIMSDSGGLSGGNAIGEANESSSSADLSIDEKKKVKSKGKSSKGQGRISPGKPGQLQCNQCNKLFNNSSALAKHKLTHSEERKFLCTICEKKFKRQDHLNGHLMTHRDKKPYQCTVPGCTKSYCDARSLRRHLENHHQHTVEQIAVEMVKAQSMAAEVLADVAASTGMVPQSSATNQRSSTDPNSAKSETVTGVKTSSNTPVTVTNMLVTKTQYVPVSMVSSAVVTSNTVTSTQPQTQAQQSHIFPYDIMVQQQQKMQKEQQQQVKKQQQQQIKLEKQQLKQQQQQKEIQQQEQRLKQEKEQQELKINLIHEEIKAAVQREQQQQQHIVSSSPKPAWQDPRLVQNNFGSHPNSQPGSGLQSPSSGESQSPGYTPMSPSVGGPQPQSPIRSPAQLLYSSPQGASIAMTGSQSTQSAGEAYSEEMIKPISCNVCKKRFKTLPALNGHLRLHGGKDPALKEERKKKEKNHSNPGKAATTTSSHVNYSSTTAPQPTNSTVQLARDGENLGVRESQFRRPVQSPVQSPPVQQDRDAQAQMNLQLIQQYQQQIQLHQEQLEQQKQQELQIQQQIQQQLQQQIENGNLDIQQIVQLQIAEQQQQQHKLTQLDIQQLQQLQLQQLQQEKQQQQLELRRHQEQQLEQQQQHACMMEQVSISTPSPQVPSSPHVAVPSSPLVARSPHPAQSHMLQRQSSMDSVQSPLQSPPVHAPPPYQLVRPDMRQELPGLNSRGGDSYIQHIQNQLQTQNSNVLHSGIGQVTFDPRSSYHDNTVIRQETFLGQQDQIDLAVSANNQSDDINTLDNITEVLNKIEGEEQARRQARSVHSHQVETIHDINRLNSASVKNSIAHFSGKPYSHSVQNPFYSSSTPGSISQGDSQSIESSHYHAKQEPIQHISSKPLTLRAAQQRPSSFQNNSLTDNNGSVESVHNDHSNVPYSPMSPIRESADFFAPVSPVQKKNVEIKRRLSAGPEDFMSNRSNIYSSSSFTKENISGTYIKPIQTNGANRPRMRSKSGEDHKLLRWRSEDHSFMKPKTRFDEYAHRPRSKTDEHLSKWNNKDVLSRSDGAGVFRNPTSFPSSFKIKRKNRPAPLIIPPHQNHCGFQSRLRSPRVWFEGADISHSVTVPYTPPPMLSPVRQGSGLFWSLSGSFPTSAGAPPTPRSATQSLIRSASIKTEEGVKAEGAPPESDVLPHVNVGSQYQAVLPDFNPNKIVAQHSPTKEDLLWDPSLMAGVSDEDVQLYQDLACCAAVKANGANVEHALHLLYLAKGNIQNAMLMLMTGPVSLPSSHSLIDYKYQESDTWSSEDVENYTQALFKHDKDFFGVANEMKTKSVKQCIQFYYLWKKVLPDDHKRLRVMRRKREQLYNLRSRQQAEQQKAEAGITVAVTATATEAIVEEDPEAMAEAEESDSESSISGTGEDRNTEKDEDEELTEAAMSDSPTAMPQNIPSPVAVPPVQQAFTCDYPECNSSFSSKPALNAHLKIHIHNSKPVGRASPSELRTKGQGRTRKPSPSAARAPAAKEDQQEGVFPCKLCGRVFSKVKSRSAHMKIHRPDQDKEKEKKAKAANRQALMAQKPLKIDPFAYDPPVPNGPLN